ncbi:MAG: DNA polymerase III subunit gamma/tau [Alphaproteobacteria bacterium]|nr:DNA polymerase III subunit gamma/tau [Alphaproteobacteria bacterium]MBQ8677723.1 DNA polymerase III subunit gamma/tau [Alphaproteobacteria bacterium]
MAEENTDNQYVVLARKYRPQNFEDLLGQDALVQTLTNAIKNNRLHHAYILTGIRGVGKTTTARLIAKALNCTGLDGKGGPTITPCNACENCKAIAAGRHIDVLELDAASRTGVDDMREILDGVRYKPTNARYKIYIIDEVHMLSKSAFNALLKTLEEPPAHVKFIFATTEIRKVPVTVLSRCQRFDLQRLSIEDLLKLFHKITAAENLKADEEALHMIAKAADGSARDGLSLLDQAISLGAGTIKADIVKEMIGLADVTQTFELFESLIAGDSKQVIITLQEQYKNGADPLSLLKDLIALTHLIAKVKLVPSFINDSSVSEAEREFCAKVSDKLTIAVLSKIWQMMMKGIGELQMAPVQIDALEMILIRVAYSASLPTPYELLNDVKKNSEISPLPHHSESVVPSSAPIFEKKTGSTEPLEKAEKSEQFSFKTIEDIINLLENKKYPLLVYSLKHDISVKELADGLIKVTAAPDIHPEFISNLVKTLTDLTGRRWQVEIIKGALGETIADKEAAETAREQRDVMEYPLVRAIMAEFKGAKIESLVRKQQSSDSSETEELGEASNDLIFDEDNE